MTQQRSRAVTEKISVTEIHCNERNISWCINKPWEMEKDWGKAIWMGRGLVGRWAEPHNLLTLHFSMLGDTIHRYKWLKLPTTWTQQVTSWSEKPGAYTPSRHTTDMLHTESIIHTCHPSDAGAAYSDSYNIHIVCAVQSDDPHTVCTMQALYNQVQSDRHRNGWLQMYKVSNLILTILYTREIIGGSIIVTIFL